MQDCLWLLLQHGRFCDTGTEIKQWRRDWHLHKTLQRNEKAKKSDGNDDVFLEGSTECASLPCLPVYFLHLCHLRQNAKPSASPPSQPTQREVKEDEEFGDDVLPLNSNSSSRSMVSRLACCARVCPRENLTTERRELHGTCCVIIIINQVFIRRNIVGKTRVEADSQPLQRHKVSDT